MNWTGLDATLLVCTHPKCLVKPMGPFSENCIYTHKIEVVKFIEGKGKVKFTLEQATKAQRGSRCITLLFL